MADTCRSAAANAEPIDAPPLSAFEAQLKGRTGREISTTMAFVRILTTLMRDKEIGKRIVPIVPDESRTFGMEGMFRQFGIFCQVGQLYQPAGCRSADVLQARTSRARCFRRASTRPAPWRRGSRPATIYSTSNTPMMPFYIFYSMFGFQRVGDLAWAAGDMRARGFLIGGTSGRTTLNGEGLQHEDGHSHILSATIPNCISYDPTFGYEVAVIVQNGLKRMLTEQEDVFYYLTLLNENYQHPAMPEGAEDGIVQGHVPASRGAEGAPGQRVQLLGSRRDPARGDRRRGAAGEGLRHRVGHLERHELHGAGREALDAERWNMLHPLETPRVPYVTQ